MAIKIKFSKNELKQILLNYNLGFLEDSKVFAGGSVQTNILLKTTKRKYVLRYYKQGRPLKSVLFEVNLIKFLKKHNYPCPGPLKNKNGKYVDIFRNKPIVIFEYVEGQQLESPNDNQEKKFIAKVAKLHNIVKSYRPLSKRHRLNYSVELCRKLAKKEAKKINTASSRKKLKWHNQELSKLNLPVSLPKGICHADFHFSNVLYKNGKFNALIDFDDANYTYFMFDLVGLIEYGVWKDKKKKTLDFNKAKKIVTEYSKYRQLNDNEKRHLFDVYKLSILFDCIWYFKRGNVKNFKEKNKIDFLNNVGRENFYQRLFNKN